MYNSRMRKGDMVAGFNRGARERTVTGSAPSLSLCTGGYLLPRRRRTPHCTRITSRLLSRCDEVLIAALADCRAEALACDLINQH